MSRSRRTDLIRCLSSAFLLCLCSRIQPLGKNILGKIFWIFCFALSLVYLRTLSMEPPTTVATTRHDPRGSSVPACGTLCVWFKNYAMILNFIPVLGSITILPVSLLHECSVARSTMDSPLSLTTSSCFMCLLPPERSRFGALIFILIISYKGVDLEAFRPHRFHFHRITIRKGVPHRTTIKDIKNLSRCNTTLR